MPEKRGSGSPTETESIDLRSTAEEESYQRGEPNTGGEKMSGLRILVVSVVVMAISVALFLLIFVTSDATAQVELRKELAKVLLQIAAVGAVGAYLKHLLQQYATERQEQLEKTEQARASQEAKHKSRLQALNLLTTNYWQIKKSLHIILAHRSALSYGKQMREIIDFRLELQRLNNEIEAAMYDLDRKDDIGNFLKTMDGHLERLINEWKKEYLPLSRQQKKDEETNNPLKKKVPGRIEGLTELNKIMTKEFAALHDPFEEAANLIRDQLRTSEKAMLEKKEEI